ncbi:hypothetical protein CYMTET_10120 [Cymbomonas tetramitiformis]|uniref:Uncharacterized protein n=1 Tax=Cymbomonas tetramitiformis TaxID=36881 RepID=A0AAE0LES7_9CHLO|nr:hypothetical protein CYMTET_10120 [Cymbomonas tetramitiformis]
MEGAISEDEHQQYLAALEHNFVMKLVTFTNQNTDVDDIGEPAVESVASSEDRTQENENELDCESLNDATTEEAPRCRERRTSEGKYEHCERTESSFVSIEWPGNFEDDLGKLITTYEQGITAQLESHKEL